jgi:hypothetical protein
MALNDIIAGLAVNLTLETAAFQKGATIAEKRAETMKGKFSGVSKGIVAFGAAIAGSALIDEIGGLVSRGLEYASSLGETAQQLGVTTKALQVYRYAGSQVGIEQDSMDKSLGRLTKTIGQAEQGNKALGQAFGRLGISVDDLKGKGTDEVMRMIAEGLGRIPDAAQRAAIEVALFGKEGQKLDTLLAGGAEGIDNLTNAAQKLGIVLSDEQIAKADEAHDKLDALKQVLSAQIAGVVADNAGAIVKLADSAGTLSEKIIVVLAKLDEWTDKFNESYRAAELWRDHVIAAIGGAIQSVVSAVASIPDKIIAVKNEAVAAVEGIYTGIKTWLGDKLSATIEWVNGKIQAIGDKFKWLYDVVVGHSYVPDMVDKIGSHMGRLKELMVDPATKAADATASKFEQMAHSVLGTIDGMVNDIKSGDWIGVLEQTLTLMKQVGIIGGGGAMPAIDPSLPNVVGMARGGSMMIGGRGGVDSNLLSINGSPVARVSRGEWLSVANDRGPSRGNTVINMNGVMTTDQFWAQIGRVHDSAAATGSSMAVERIGRARRQALGRG